MQKVLCRLSFLPSCGHFFCIQYFHQTGCPLGTGPNRSWLLTAEEGIQVGSLHRPTLCNWQPLPYTCPSFPHLSFFPFPGASLLGRHCCFCSCFPGPFCHVTHVRWSVVETGEWKGLLRHEWSSSGDRRLSPALDTFL